MDGLMFFSPMIFFYILLLFIHLVEKFESLSIELIHPFSPNSPFYDPNITYSEMVKRFDSQSRPRVMTTWNSTFPSLKIVPLVSDRRWGFHAKLNLGTFHDRQPSYKTHYLHFDTASDITWIECEDCAKPGGNCVHEHTLAYPNSKSRSYAPLHYYHHPLCSPDEYIGRYCSYKLRYDDNSYSIGILAYETFTFESSHTHPAEIVRIVMGCGIFNRLEVITNGYETGIMGLGWGPHSFANQISGHSKGRFSYCLPPLFSESVRGQSTILRFGHDTPTVRGLHSLSILRYWREEQYYVKLQGISINNKRLNIPPQYFTKTSPKKGGCIFDTGTTFSYISLPAYKILKEEMIHHLSIVDKSLEITMIEGELDLCFMRQTPFKGYAHLPTITFHFEGGVNLVVQRHNAFWVLPETDKEIVCMGISPAGSDNLAIIGTQSQANHVFVYDLSAKKVYFGPRDCVQNP